ncbi:hypothetical protein G3I59_27185 [Amycolatopsis rubida]|uniref:Uncharacterized protein n=1 Tax=Amycolatopsis rubida TaxID=112413 RepID=A0ABX0BY70_9PSEU|nr:MULTISPECIES: hypothetical protein [Amycolatopsis]MYW94183.1 hypothetical protein [Amycolatopsis rubida]NEC59172.1 hypothetical protein [Amycolatopsis rubida]OAP20888.1 hypothetical protein A4R44_08333 [Amycolatopsis sp. M39]
MVPATSSGSAAVAVSAGWRSNPAGSMPGTGSRNRTQTPRAALAPNAGPRSASDSRMPSAPGVEELADLDVGDVGQWRRDELRAEANT